MYDISDNEIIYVTPETFGFWKLFALPTCGHKCERKNNTIVTDQGNIHRNWRDRNG